MRGMWLDRWVNKKKERGMGREEGRKEERKRWKEEGR
jgi:hypothetical protein